MSEENPHPRVVFDCMVYLQATVNESGPAAVLLRLVDNDEIALFVSREVLEEVREVLSRPKIRQRNPAITTNVWTHCSSASQKKPLFLMTFGRISRTSVIRRMRSTSTLHNTSHRFVHEEPCFIIRRRAGQHVGCASGMMKLGWTVCGKVSNLR